MQEVIEISRDQSVTTSSEPASPGRARISDVFSNLSDDLERVSVLPDAVLDDLPRTWHLDRSVGGDASLTISTGVEFRGAIDPDCLEAETRRFVAEQPMLKLCFPAIDGRFAVGHARLPERLVQGFDLRLSADPWREAVRLVRNASEKPFDLARGPLFQLMHFQLPGGRHGLHLLGHHIVWDLRSMQAALYTILMRSLGIPLHAAANRKFVPRPARFDQTAAVEFWREQLSGVDWRSPFRPRDPDPGQRYVGRASEMQPFEIGPSDMAALRAVRDATFSSGSSACTTAIQIALALATGRSEITVLFPVPVRVDPTTVCNSAMPYPITLRLSDDMPARMLFSSAAKKQAAIVRHGDKSMMELARELSADGSFRHPGVLVSFGAHLDILTRMEPGLGARPWPMIRAETDLDLASWFVSDADFSHAVMWLQWRDGQVPDRVPPILYDAWCEILGAVAANAGTMVADLAKLPSVGLLAEAMRRPLVAVSSSFVADPVAPFVSRLTELVGQPTDIAFGGFDQVIQDLMSEESGLRRNRDGVNIVLMRLEDRINNADISGDGLAPARAEDVLTEAVEDHLAAFRAAIPRMKVPTILIACPGTGPWHDIAALKALRDRAEVRLLDELRGLPGLSILSWSEAEALYRPKVIADPARERLGHIPYSEAGYAVIATAAMRRMHELTRRPVKVIVVDCDNTLWRGAVGEEGAAGVVFHQGHLALQERLAEASRSGILVCLCSKNIEEDVAAVLSERSEMCLKSEHITASRVNWLPKSHNIRELAADLGLGLDSFVFLDDNPVEISEVSAALPDVTCLRVPEDEKALTEFARHLWLLDKSAATGEDRRRTAMYQESAEREASRRIAGNFADFVVSLGLKVTEAEVNAGNLARIAQLTQRTNQFNINPKPLAETDIAARLADKDVVIEALNVSDRFGSYGLVGLIIARKAASALDVETFLMSCRVLGRGVEHHMVRALGLAALAGGLPVIRMTLRSTARNVPVRRFFEHVPQRRAEAGDRAILEIDAAAAADFSFSVAEGEADLAAYEQQQLIGEGASMEHSLASHSARGLEAIALNFTSAAAILDWFDPARNVAASHDTDTGARLLSLIEEIAGRRDVDLDMTIVQLGLDSFALVTLLAGIEERLGARLGIEHFMRAPKLADLVAIIDAGGKSDGIVEDPDLPIIERDLALPRSIVPNLTAGPIASPPHDIFLTGATGFLGGFLLRELMRRSDATVHCLVRAANDAQAAERLAAALRSGPHADFAAMVGSRIQAIAGDVALPDYGLDEVRFAGLQQEIDLVLHNAAAVNFVAPYEELRQTNVEGTRTAMRLAAHGRIKPLHFISTVAVLGADSFLGVERVSPEEMPETAADVMLGYGRTKWVAERNLRSARARGLPVTIYRPGNITGDTETGYWPAGDAMTRMLQGFARLGAMPDLPLALDFTPVGYVAAAVVGLLLNPESRNRGFHIVHPQPVTSMQFGMWLVERGLVREKLPMREFVPRLTEAVRADPKMPIAAILPLFTARFGRHGLSFLELVAWRPQFDTAATQALLTGSGVAVPEIGTPLFDAYARELRRQRYLE